MGYFFTILFGTFVLEDVALISAIGLMNHHQLSFTAAFLACFLGISLGDLGLYVLGFAVAWFGFEHHWLFLKINRAALLKMKESQVLTYSILVSRVIPGTRLPTYFGAGFLKYPFFRFLGLTLLSVFLWVWMAFLGGKSIHVVLIDHWILSGLFVLFFLQVIKTLLPKLADPWERKALLHSWRKWTHFEFWPAWFFYLPIVPYYLYLSWKQGTLLAPFYASPGIAHGGLIGESKWDFLKHLDPEDPATLKAVRLGANVSLAEAKETLQREKFQYPWIIKPDVGQRGFGVRIIENESELAEYLSLAPFDRIFQRLSSFTGEAGLFYVRMPGEESGRIFSLTDKRFPFVMGDGKSKLGDLILKDKRARIIASVYFARLRSSLDSVPLENQRVQLSECGNHCQGAVFLNGKHLITDSLARAVHKIARQVPDFYFGRFDVRYRDVESLQRGEGFEIVEINGSGSEATHIWDPSTRLLEAYGVLFEQWRMLFAIGGQIRRQAPNSAKINLWEFLKECFRVFFRKDKLSVSS